jgi:hypothetical protein
MSVPTTLGMTTSYEPLEQFGTACVAAEQVTDPLGE